MLKLEKEYALYVKKSYRFLKFINTTKYSIQYKGNSFYGLNITTNYVN